MIAISTAYKHFETLLHNLITFCVGASAGIMCDSFHLRIANGDVNNTNHPEITDASVVKPWGQIRPPSFSFGGCQNAKGSYMPSTYTHTLFTKLGF
jgi:hypothetical protein